jgi:hypothetical protein
MNNTSTRPVLASQDAIENAHAVASALGHKRSSDRRVRINGHWLKVRDLLAVSRQHATVHDFKWAVASMTGGTS